MNITMNRRRFLSALGLTGAATAVAPGIGLRSALADSGPPKRIIIVSTGHGTVYDGWRMRPGNRSDAAIWEENLSQMAEDEFSRALAPLYAHRDRMLVLDGLSMVTPVLDIPGFHHEKGWLHAWTGAPVLFTGQDLFSTAPSLDQLIANQIARVDRLHSLELTVNAGRPICHAGLAQQLPLENSPQRVFDRLFGLSTSSDPLVRAQGSVLDFALAEHKAISPSLSKPDREKLSAHFDLVRQLEQRIAGMRDATCSDAPDIGALASTWAGYNALYQSMADLIAAAFSCDLTRVATLSLGDLPSEDFGWGDYLSGDAHNDFAHRIYVDPQAALAMTDYTRLHATQLAYLIDLLSAMPDSDGRSLMDNTLIVWGSELGDGWHGYHRYCALTVGGDWHFNTGRYVHWPATTSAPVQMITEHGVTSGAGMPHQHLLVSCAQAMGLSDDFIGLPDVTTRNNERISLTGPLTEMLG
ncbi:MAG: DUF1552 domain-containing protein [Myxococcota bacterium]